MESHRQPARQLAALLALPLIASAVVAGSGAARADAVRTAAPVADPTQTSFSVGALVLQYYPLTSNGQNIDIGVTGDVGDPVATIRLQVGGITADLQTFLTRGTAYHGYADPGATPSLTYHVVDTREVDQAVPTVPNPHYNGMSDVYRVRPDYNSIMSGAGICDYVQNRGVDEVWMFAYQGPSQLGISESEISGAAR